MLFEDAKYKTTSLVIKAKIPVDLLKHNKVMHDITYKRK